MFIAISQFTIANDKTEEVKQAFRDRPHLVEQAAGFLRMEVISPRELPEEIWLVTHWETEQAFSRGITATSTAIPIKGFQKDSSWSQRALACASSIPSARRTRVIQKGLLANCPFCGNIFALKLRSR